MIKGFGTQNKLFFPFLGWVGCAEEEKADIEVPAYEYPSTILPPGYAQYAAQIDAAKDQKRKEEEGLLDFGVHVRRRA